VDTGSLKGITKARTRGRTLKMLEASVKENRLVQRSLEKSSVDRARKGDSRRDEST